MCIAILKPKDKTISKETLQECCNNNKDGMGFAYTDGNTVYINKYMNFDDFYKDYKEVETTSTMLIHFRIATHGKVEVKNCHPFKLNNRMALIHNGVISGYGDKENKTDTQDFIDKVIGNISWKLWKNPSYRELVGKAIGYSKLAILDVTGNYFIINEDKGEWNNGVWYSNRSYIKHEPVKYYDKEKVTQKKLYDYDYDDDDDYNGWYGRLYKKQKEQDKKEQQLAEDNDFKIIYKCSKCGKEFTELDDIADPQCDVCKSTEVLEIGVAQGKEKYYYSDMIG